MWTFSSRADRQLHGRLFLQRDAAAAGTLRASRRRWLGTSAGWALTLGKFDRGLPRESALAR